MTFKIPETMTSFRKCPNKFLLNTLTDAAEKEEDKGQSKRFEIILRINHK